MENISPKVFNVRSLRMKRRNKTIQSLRSEEWIGINSVIIYPGTYFAVFDLDDYTEIIIDLNEEARSRLQKWIKVFKQRDKLRGSWGKLKPL